MTCTLVLSCSDIIQPTLFSHFSKLMEEVSASWKYSQTSPFIFYLLLLAYFMLGFHDSEARQLSDGRRKSLHTSILRWKELAHSNPKHILQLMSHRLTVPSIYCMLLSEALFDKSALSGQQTRKMKRVLPYTSRILHLLFLFHFCFSWRFLFWNLRRTEASKKRLNALARVRITPSMCKKRTHIVVRKGARQFVARAVEKATAHNTEHV